MTGNPTLDIFGTPITVLIHPEPANGEQTNKGIGDSLPDNPVMFCLLVLGIILMLVWLIRRRRPLKP